jgi:hypothetical protein
LLVLGQFQVNKVDRVITLIIDIELKLFILPRHVILFYFIFIRIPII